jgi:hypothetical protein
MDNGASLSQNLTGNYIYASPFWLPRDFLLKEFGVLVNTVTTANTDISWGIYCNNFLTLSYGQRYPGNLIVEAYYNNIPSANFYSSSLSPPILLKGQRLYWAALSLNTDGVQTFRCGGTALNLLGWQSGDTTYPLVSKRAMSLSRTHTQALPNPFPSGAQDYRFAPTMFIRELNQSGS